MMPFWKDPYAWLLAWLKNLLASWGATDAGVYFWMSLLGALILGVLPLLITIWLIWAERKLLGRVQDRIGPNRVGPFGFFQTIADMGKIFTKEFITPIGADWLPYNIAPILSVAAVLLLWGVIPFTSTMYGVDFSIGLLYLVAVGALGEMAIILAGWSSNNKYALMAAFRAVAQLVSYEVPLVVTMLIPAMLAGSLSLQAIVAGQAQVWNVFVAPLAAFIFFMASIAEVGRAPFDLLEAESELVSGFNIEYSGLKFGFYYVADFLHAFTVALLFATLFLGGWQGPWVDQIPFLGFVWYLIKTVIVWFAGLMLRGSLPRFRIDQMMNLAWKRYTPLAIASIILTALVHKLVVSQPVWLYVAIMFVSNIILWAVLDWWLGRFQPRRPRPEVADRSRPVARPPETPAPSMTETGVQS
jgi:NADH-quinone oxidoreductase subunit H